MTMKHVPPTDIKSRAELTPAERLLNLCSLCLMPPIIIQIPCAGRHIESSFTIWQY